MLKDLIKNYSVIHIGGREYRVRYSLNALLCLEMTYKPLSDVLKTDWKSWSIDDVIQLCRAGMCDRKCNRRAVNARRFELIKPELSELGSLIQVSDLPLLRLELVTAVLDSLPQTHGDGKKPEENPLAERQMRAFYCDIMHRPEKEFFESTYREIDGRTEDYLVAKGLKKPPAVIQLDD